MVIIPVSYNENDRPNVTRLTEDFSKSGYFINCSGKVFIWIESMGFWQIIAHGEAVRSLRKFLGDSDQSRVKDSVLKKIAEYMRNLSQLETVMEPHKTKINLLNGVLDIETLQMEEHSRELGFDYCYRFSYQNDLSIYEAKNFLKYVKTSIGIDPESDKFSYLLQLMGYLLVRNFAGKKAVFFQGPSEIGKSRILHLLENVFGNFSSVPLSSLGDRFRLSLMNHSYINIVHENGDGEGMVKHADIFKKIVAGEAVIIEEKGKSPQQVTLQTKLIYAVNDLPEWPLTIDRSIRNRMAVFVFPDNLKVIDRDPEIDAKLVLEKNIIFSEVCKALKTLRDNEFKFPVIKDAEALLDTHFSSLNSIEGFCEDCCVFGIDQRVHYKSLYEAYVRHCKKNLYTKVSETLLKKYFLAKPGVEPDRFRDHGVNIRGLRGVGLQDMVGGEY